jgi:hypothetical protein
LPSPFRIEKMALKTSSMWTENLQVAPTSASLGESQHLTTVSVQILRPINAARVGDVGDNEPRTSGECSPCLLRACLKAVIRANSAKRCANSAWSFPRLRGAPRPSPALLS